MISWFGAITPAERARVWTGPAVFRQPDARPFSAAPGSTPLRRVLHFDQTSWLPDNLLERMDMMTMAASIEARAPFMDVRLAEFASTLPDSCRIKGGVTKRIVREALGSAPAAISSDPAQERFSNAGDGMVSRPAARSGKGAPARDRTASAAPTSIARRSGVFWTSMQTGQQES